MKIPPNFRKRKCCFYCIHSKWVSAIGDYPHRYECMKYNNYQVGDGESCFCDDYCDDYSKIEIK